MDLISDKGLAQRFIKTSLALTARVFSAFEGLAFGNDPPALPPVFIVGLPRGGTTLVYQVLCHSFKMAYTPMLSNSLIFAPSLAARMSKPGSSKYSSDFQSDYGMSSGWSSPGEGGMWNLWFNKDQHYDSPDELESWKAREIVRMAGRIERMGRGPFLNKNLRHNNRLKVLAGLFPEAVFLVVLRDPRETAVSLLRGRMDKLGDASSWFSTRPRAYNSLKNLAPEQAVAAQIKELISDLAEDIAFIGPDRFAAVDYADFCAAPGETLARLLEFLNRHGLSLETLRAPPSSFKISKNRAGQITPSQLEAVDTSISEFFEDNPMDDIPCRWLSKSK